MNFDRGGDIWKKQERKRMTTSNPARKTKSVLGKRPVKENKKSTAGSPNILNYRKLRVGAKILSIIKEVHEQELILALPSFLTATCVIGGSVMKRMYKVGEYVTGVIDGLEKKGEHKRVSVSIAPEIVNEGLLVEEVTVGQVLMGRIASKEEKGLLVELGLMDKIPGFLPNSGVNGDIPVGKTIMFTVKEKNSRLLILSTDVKVTCKIPKLGMAERSLIPGSLFSLSSEENSCGHLVKFAGDLKGRLDSLCISEPSSHKSARLIYADASNNRYLLSLSHSDLQKTVGEEFAVGDVIETAKVVQVDKTVGVKFNLPSGCGGYAHLSKLSDERLEQGVPTQRFKVGSVHQVRVIGFDPFSSLYSLTLKKSDMEREIKSYGELKVGQIVKGKVARVESYGVLCRLKGDLKAMIPNRHLPEDAKLKVDDKLQGIVTEVQGKRVTVSMLPELLDNSRLATYEDAQVDSYYMGLVVSVKDFGAIVRFLGDVKALLPLAEMSEKYVKDPKEYVQEGQWLKVRITKCDAPNKKLICSLKTNETNQIKSEVKKEVKKQDQKKADVVVPSLADFITEEPEKEVESTPMQTNNLSLRDVTDEYEKKLICGPNSSILWIEYISVLLKLGDLEQARKIAERALQTITYRVEEERRNVWVAYLNMECFYGTKASMVLVFNRAAAQNDPLEVHMAMASILSSDPSKHADALEFYERMTKKFKECVKVWMSYATWLMASQGETEARALLPKSLKSLPKREHISMTQQFALLEYSQGGGERGRMLFEGIIASYPKRLDVWLVYLAQEEKHPKENIIQIRSIYERLLTQKLSTKKAKCVFKQYLEFEKAHGTVQNVEHVKQLARAFVEAKN